LILADSLLGLFSPGISYEALKISAGLKTWDKSDFSNAMTSEQEVGEYMIFS